MENSSDKELEPQELDEIISKLKESVQSDIRQAAVWNTLGFVLLKTGRLQVQVPSSNSCNLIVHLVLSLCFKPFDIFECYFCN